MMPQVNRHKLSVLAVLAGTLLLSGCSWLSSFRIENMTDNVDYRGGSGSVGNLEVPPGLTTPQFDDTYAVNRAPSQSTGSRLEQQANGLQQVPGAGAEMSPSPGGSALPVSLTQLKDGNPALVVGAGFDQVWAQTGVILTRLGVNRVGEQRDQGIYSVSTGSGAPAQQQQDGFFSGLWSKATGLFGSDEKKGGDIYRIIIGDRGEQCLIVIGDEAGKPLDVANATQVLQRLKAEFER